MRYYNQGNMNIILCTNCRNKLRVPSDKGKISVSCPVCGKRFTYNPKSIIDEFKQLGLYIKSKIPKKKE